jgi:hypothetical protein
MPTAPLTAQKENPMPTTLQSSMSHALALEVDAAIGHRGPESFSVTIVPLQARATAINNGFARAARELADAESGPAAREIDRLVDLENGRGTKYEPFLRYLKAEALLRARGLTPES